MTDERLHHFSTRVLYDNRPSSSPAKEIKSIDEEIAWRLTTEDNVPWLTIDTAISRDEVFREVSSVNPRSVTVFLDTCYSGDTRGGSRLVAGRPLRIVVLEEPVPPNFTALTAAGGDQIAKPFKEAQHGMFSYFLMKEWKVGLIPTAITRLLPVSYIPTYGRM